MWIPLYLRFLIGTNAGSHFTIAPPLCLFLIGLIQERDEISASSANCDQKQAFPRASFWLDIALWFITSSKTGNSHNSICVTSENKWLPSNNEWHLLSGPVWPTKKCLLTSITTSGVSGLYLWRIKTFKDTLSVNSRHLKWLGEANGEIKMIGKYWCQVDRLPS